MFWKKDKLKPTQPYFVFDTKDFYQEVYLQQGISHFYTYYLEEDKPLRTVPDDVSISFLNLRKEKCKGMPVEQD